VRALSIAREVDVEMPLISDPAEQQGSIQLALEQILDTGRKNVGILGFSFKAGTEIFARARS
jgi:hypothetical protein